MNNRIFLILCAMMVAAWAMAQMNAKDITKIKKSNEYVYAEATEATEDEAIDAAKAELDLLVEEYVVSSGLAKDAVAVIVKNIRLMTSKIAIMRGDMHRVFLYVKKKDIVTSKSDVTVMNVASAEQDTQVDDDIATDEESNVDAAQNDVVYSQEEKAAEQPLSGGFFAQIKGNRATTLAKIAKAVSMEHAESILLGEKSILNVKGYGSQENCRNTTQSYWVVETPYGVTILSPERSGKRWNYKTGNIDSLDKYPKRLWFRL